MLITITIFGLLCDCKNIVGKVVVGMFARIGQKLLLIYLIIRDIHIN